MPPLPPSGLCASGEVETNARYANCELRIELMRRMSNLNGLSDLTEVEEQPMGSCRMREEGREIRRADKSKEAEQDETLTGLKAGHVGGKQRKIV